jgi:hypothetical protein
MTNITEAQRKLLSAAAAEPEGVIEAPAETKIAKALIKNGLAIFLPVAGERPSRLLITNAGRAAIEPTPMPEPSADDPEPPTAAAEEGEAPTDTDATEEPTANEPSTADAGPQADGEQGEGDAAVLLAASGGRRAKTSPTGKLGTLVELLKRPTGATLDDMTKATGWQVHSVRGAMSGSLKKGFGFSITNEKTDAGRVYRIATVEGEA